MKKIILSLVAIILSATFVNAQISINSAEDFLKIGVDASYPLNGNYIQTADINLGALTNSQIGVFSGTYNGGDFTIMYNATYGNDASVIYGLFSVNDGTIQNLKISANVLMGGVASHVGLICGRNNGTISNCEVNGMITANVGARYAGLVAGRSMGSSAVINRCVVSGQVAGAQYVGGVIGSSTGVIKACEFNGTIYSRGYSEYDEEDEQIVITAYAGGITARGDVYSSYANPVINLPIMTTTSTPLYYGITPNTANGCVLGANAMKNGVSMGESDIAMSTITCFVAPFPSAAVYALNNAASSNNAVGVNWSVYAEEEVNSDYTVVNSGNFNSFSTWGVAPPINLHNTTLPEGGVTITIPSGKTLRLNTTLVLSENVRLTNNGTLVICSGGDLVNTTSNNVTGNIIVEKSNLSNGNWYLTAAPFTNYTMDVVQVSTSDTYDDVAAVAYDYSTGNWANSYMTLQDNMSAGESFFLWPFFNSGVVNFVSNGCTLNNGNVSVTKNVSQNTSNGYWVALANPYPGELNVAKFLATCGVPSQGRVVYLYSNGSFDAKLNGVLPVTEGFFVNVVNPGNTTINFTKSQLDNYQSSAKSTTLTQEFIDFAVEYDYKSIAVHFAQNDEAEQTYDIFDANKLFATTGVIEPYFVTDGIPLIKEEVKELPYYATLNVRSLGEDTIRLVAKNIPENYAITLIAGEQTIDMVEGDMYETVVYEGENEDRFKLLVKKSLSLSDVEEYELAIINDNRQVNILSQDKMNVEVYNALGQKVYQTNNSSFVLNNVPAGAYIIKAKTDKGIASQKIVIN